MDEKKEAQGRLQELINKWVEVTYSGRSIEQTEIEDFLKVFTEAYGYVDFYNCELDCFGGTDEFPFSIISLEECIEDVCDLEDEEVVGSFRWRMQCESDTFYFLRGINATDGRSVWILVHCVSMGQGGVQETVEDLFISSLDAEKYLRSIGYVFGEGAPSGKVDTFTDEEIIELVQKARESEKQH